MEASKSTTPSAPVKKKSSTQYRFCCKFLIFLVVSLAALVAYLGLFFPLYEFIRLPLSTGARCLDGSPAGFYYYKGKEQDKYLIFFLGGGWCGTPIFASENDAHTFDETVASCAKRSKYLLGRSDWPRYFSFDWNIPYFGHFGILSRNAQRNPAFSEYNTIYITYCDGSWHQGYREDPIQYDQDTQLWFRGENNTKGVLQYAFDNLGLAGAKEVVVSGMSAGGIAASIWVDYIAERMREHGNARVRGVLDSPLFFDEQNALTNQHSFTKNLQNLVALVNTQTLPPNRGCAEANRDSLWKCFQGEDVIKYIKTPSYLVQSLIDTYTIRHIMGLKCVSVTDVSFDGHLHTCNADEKNAVARLDARTRKVIDDQVLPRDAWGVWAPSCLIHVGTFMDDYYNGRKYRVPADSQLSLAALIKDWLDTDGRTPNAKIVDKVSYPYNSACANSEDVRAYAQQSKSDL